MKKEAFPWFNLKGQKEDKSKPSRKTRTSLKAMQKNTSFECLDGGDNSKGEDSSCTTDLDKHLRHI